MIMKKKYRYVLTMLSSNEQPNETELLKKIKEFMGVMRFAYANPSIIKSFQENKFVIKCIRGYESDIINALSFIKQLNGKRTGIYTIKTSGTLKSLRA